MKDSSGVWESGVWETTKMYLERFAKSRFDVFVGRETYLLDTMRLGGAGTISATATVSLVPLTSYSWSGGKAPWQKRGRKIKYH